MLEYTGVLHLSRWCRQNSHMTCSKTRWRSTSFTVLRYFSVFPDRLWYLFILKKLWSLSKGIESTCILSFFVVLLGSRVVLFFLNSYSNRLSTQKVLSFACFRWLFWRAPRTLKSLNQDCPRSTPSDRTVT